MAAVVDVKGDGGSGPVPAAPGEEAAVRVPVQPETFPAIPMLSGIRSATAALAGFPAVFPAVFRLRSPGRITVHQNAQT